MSSPYQLFNTDKNLEQTGVTLDYGHFWIKVARAGGSNKRYNKIAKDKLQPYQAQLRTETMDEVLADKLFREIFAESVVLGWGSTELGSGVLPDAEGNPLEFTTENCIKLFQDLPDLFNDVREQANKISLFKKEEIKEALKNS